MRGYARIERLFKERVGDAGDAGNAGDETAASADESPGF